jgi:hypothetical protein
MRAWTRSGAGQSGRNQEEEGKEEEETSVMQRTLWNGVLGTQVPAQSPTA